jgi:hypothetical protein
MKITVFTGNQPRHTSLVRRLASFGEVYAIQECTTLFPGAVADSIYGRSAVMKRYFEHVLSAEHAVFGDVAFAPAGVRTLGLKMGDVCYMKPERLGEALAADYIVIFGASYIKPPLVDVLIEKGAVNIHMGVSPYYRGSACNFWAMYDGRPELVGATIHRLSRGLDSGDILFHAMPQPQVIDPFLLGMKAVEAAHVALAERIEKGTLESVTPVRQDRNREMRYSRYADFNDKVAEEYLRDVPSATQVGAALAAGQDKHWLLNPVFR